MCSPSFRHTLKHSRKGKNIVELKLPSCEIKEIKNDVEFSNLFEQLLEKRSKYIENKLSYDSEKDKNTKIGSVPENFE